MRVAVTGARGELGRGVVAELLAHHYEVVAVHRTPDGRQSHDGPLENRVADLSDSVAAREALAGCDAVLHLAAIPNPNAAAAPRVFANNVDSTFNVLHAATELGIERVIYASSESVLGNPWAATLQPLRYVPVDEAHPCVLFDPYGFSKLVGEQTCDLFANRAGLRVLSFRLPAIWPPEQYPQRINGRLTNQQQAAKSLWAYLDLRDAARAFRLALKQEWEGHHVLNITARWAFGAEPVPDLLARWYPDLKDIRAPLEADTAIFDWHKADRFMGFRARYRWVREGIIDSALADGQRAPGEPSTAI